MSEFKPLTNLQINEYFKGKKGYGGTKALDQLPKKIGKKAYIINFDDSWEGGSHWVCVYNKKDKECYYFDSFGGYPPPEIFDFMEGSGKKLLRNNEQIQHVDSIMCGYYCIDVIEKLDNGNTFVDVIYDYDFNPNDNEEEIKQKFSRNR